MEEKEKEQQYFCSSSFLFPKPIAAAVLEKSNDLLQALQEQVTSQLKREKDASEARIKAYIDKEHADYTKLEKSAHDVKFTLFHKLAGLRQQAIATAISDAMGDALNDVLGNDSPVFSPLSASKSPKSGLAQVASQLQHLAAMEAVPAVVVTTEQGPQRFSPAGYNGHRGSPSSVLGASARENSDIPTLSTVGVRIPPASFTASPRFPVVPPSSVAGSFIPPSSVSNASRFSSALSEGLKSVASDSDAPPTTSTDSPKLLNRIVWNKGASSNSGSQHSNLSKSVPASRVNFGGRRDSDSSDALFDMDGFESSSSTDRHRRNDTFDEEDEEDALEEGASTGRQLAAPAADGMALYASSVPMGIPARAAASFVADDDSMAYRSRGLQVPGSPETDRVSHAQLHFAVVLLVCFHPSLTPRCFPLSDARSGSVHSRVVSAFRQRLDSDIWRSSSAQNVDHSLAKQFALRVRLCGTQ
ncbi:hypothetical protein, variant 3 [Capsaspora owczarzaki ATCC 30864]|uniref:Uncharacterized protein n=1 Tax=Capsaspora owczarzaki (strain ATCC 30864) TaxID=595528 RepID=A0A0D2ULB0_CAPO3|nr:hypothetical protein, variant 3 [Capsaspora owczarzaki ATCC 30864]